MSPEASTASNTSVHFVDDHIDTHLLREAAQLICIEASDVVIATSRLDRFDYHSRNFDSLRTLPVFNLFAYIAERGQILLTIVSVIGWVIDRVAVARGLSHGPVEGWDIELAVRADAISVARRRQATKHGAVEAVLERENTVRRRAWL